ncbi:MAG: O-acetyl-ADP-ribose deacetylase [Bacteroidales bacterium]|nr:O-acetyl-ADP-ribose deacetylase [Bacteroidales bacterium]MBK9359410.1 O-acetyl-ADP-ribose deacetylase [Bacteroidales bacterium]
MIQSRIQIKLTDITRLECDAIVNAANTRLLGGGGVDGAIHRAAGPELLEACRLLNGCKTGMAKVTPGFGLPSKFVIHTVGPVWTGGDSDEADMLESCYLESLKLAASLCCKTIAFPNISTGIYGFPKNLAAAIALKAVTEFLTVNDLPEIIIFACFDSENLAIYKSLFSTG